MTPEEVLRELRSIRYDRPPTIRGIARHAGVSYGTIYTGITTGRLTNRSCEALARVLRDVKNGRYQERRPPPPRT